MSSAGETGPKVPKVPKGAFGFSRFAPPHLVDDEGFDDLTNRGGELERWNGRPRLLRVDFFCGWLRSIIGLRVWSGC